MSITNVFSKERVQFIPEVDSEPCQISKIEHLKRSIFDIGSEYASVSLLTPVLRKLKSKFLHENTLYRNNVAERT